MDQLEQALTQTFRFWLLRDGIDKCVLITSNNDMEAYTSLCDDEYTIVNIQKDNYTLSLFTKKSFADRVENYINSLSEVGYIITGLDTKEKSPFSSTNVVVALNNIKLGEIPKGMTAGMSIILRDMRFKEENYEAELNEWLSKVNSSTLARHGVIQVYKQ